VGRHRIVTLFISTLHVWQHHPPDLRLLCDHSGYR